jgi:hypothetical protein
VIAGSLILWAIGAGSLVLWAGSIGAASPILWTGAMGAVGLSGWGWGCIWDLGGVVGTLESFATRLETGGNWGTGACEGVDADGAGLLMNWPSKEDLKSKNCGVRS